METHVARDEEKRVLRWCSHCRNFQPTVHMTWDGWHCLKCGEKIGTRPMTDGMKYE